MYPQSTDVLIDVTSLISAENFLVAQNRHAAPADPFARQCFAEVVQSLIFMSRVFVAHPILLGATPEDFGERPLLLRSLMRAGLLRPLGIGHHTDLIFRQLEDEALHDLDGVHGLASMTRFIQQALAVDRASQDKRNLLATRILEWCVFHEDQIRHASGSHTARIPTRDGVEEDAFGQWARAASLMLRGALDSVAPPGQGAYLMATLARALKYRARAQSAGISYQSHPLRRDFSITFDLTRDGATDGTVFDLIRAVRGIHETLTDAAGADESVRMQLLQFELPLLGGRLWSPTESGQHEDHDWVNIIVDRISDYRHRAKDLREAVERCVTDEDRLRLTRDIDHVKRQLLDRLGLRQVELSSVERELVESVASVASAAPGIPKVSGLWFSARSLGKQYTYTGARPYQRFLYREYINAWKKTRK